MLFFSILSRKKPAVNAAGTGAPGKNAVILNGGGGSRLAYVVPVGIHFLKKKAPWICRSAQTVNLIFKKRYSLSLFSFNP